MNTSVLKTARRPLAAALLVALVAPGMAWAETAREKALEARVAELERQVQLLVSTQQQQQGVITPPHPCRSIRRGQQRLVQLGADAPGWAALGQGLARGELEADEAAVRGEEGGDARGPLRAAGRRQGAQELFGGLRPLRQPD